VRPRPHRLERLSEQDFARLLDAGLERLAAAFS